MKRSDGLTLIELLMYLSVVCVLLLASIPLGSDFYQKKRADMVGDDIKSAIRYSRNMAFKNNVTMTLNPLSESGDWSKGIILFIDNPLHQYTNKNKIVHQWQWNYPGIQVVWRGFQSNQYITFSPVLRQSIANGQFTIVTSKQYQKGLIVNRLGHVREGI